MLVGLLGCGGPGSPGQTLRTPPPQSPPTPLDLGSPTVVAPATNGTLPGTFTLDSNGSAQPRLPTFDIRGNVGGLSIDGVPHTGVAYQAHYAFGGYDLYDVLSVASDGSDLALTWLYCVGDSLEWVYQLSYLRPMEPSRAAGSCHARPGDVQTQVQLPALLALPPPRPSGFRIVGPGINIGDGVGALVIGGRTYNAHPFATVDCTQCPGGSWYEVHLVFRRENEAGFGILYLYPAAPTEVHLSNALSFPTLERKRETYQATWSGRPLAAIQGWFSPAGEPAVTLGRPLAPLYRRAKVPAG